MSWLADRVVDHLRSVANLPDLGATKYRLEKLLGRGGMGTVYLAHDTELDRPVALKVLSFPDASGDLAARMLREARIVARLEHPGIVPIHDVGLLDEGRVFYAMKLVKGKRLDEYLNERPSLPEKIQVFQKACDAVAFAHAHGVIHRDLKPENIMVGSFGEILVMDWGLAKILNLDPQIPGEDLTRLENRESKMPHSEPIREQTWLSSTSDTLFGAVMGSPPYMAPEQERGETDRIDPRTDVYALGAILNVMLRESEATRSSDAGNRGESFFNAFSHRGPRPARIPRSLAAICSRAMEREQELRYPSAQALVDDVDRFMSGLAVSSYQENIFETIWRWLRQYRFMVLLILAYLLARIFFIFLLRS